MRKSFKDSRVFILEVLDDFGSPVDVYLLGKNRDPFGGEDADKRGLSNKEVEALSQNLSQLGSRESLCLFNFQQNLRNALTKSFFSEKLKEDLLVHVFLASVHIYHFHQVIKN